MLVPCTCVNAVHARVCAHVCMCVCSVSLVGARAGLGSVAMVTISAAQTSDSAGIALHLRWGWLGRRSPSVFWPHFQLQAFLVSQNSSPCSRLSHFQGAEHCQPGRGTVGILFPWLASGSGGLSSCISGGCPQWLCPSPSTKGSLCPSLGIEGGVSPSSSCTGSSQCPGVQCWLSFYSNIRTLVPGGEGPGRRHAFSVVATHFSGEPC